MAMLHKRPRSSDHSFMPTYFTLKREFAEISANQQEWFTAASDLCSLPQSFPQSQIIVQFKPQFPCLQRAMKVQPAPESCEDVVTENVLWFPCSLGTRERRTALVSLFPVRRSASELSRPCILGLWLLSRPKEMEQSIQTSLDFVSTTRNNRLLPVLCALSPSLLPPCWIFLQSFCH